MTAPRAEPARADIDRLVAARLAADGVRFTQGRALIITALARSHGPRGAADLQRELAGTVPISSLYRSLTVLANAGVVERSFDPSGAARFELGEWLLGHHHHLVCIECGRVEDVEIDNETERRIDRLVTDLTAASGLEPTGHRMDIEGVCGRCRAA